jgi:2-desacetyl-2-hydroxyethyl bacteriochlorophyllide A dehydrogenase
MRAVRLQGPGEVEVAQIGAPPPSTKDVLLQVRLVGMCGSDLTSFRGRNPMVAYPRVIGHEVAATVVSGAPDLAAGTAVTISPYTSCGQCAACRRERPNACVHNQTMGVQRDGAMTEQITVPREKIFTANLSLRELCLVEPLTVGFHAAARGRVTAADVVAVFGCGGIGLGAIAASAFRGAETIAIDLDAAKLEVASKAGAKHLINTRNENLHERLREISHGRGPDVIIEAIGLPETFRAAVDEVAFTGRVVYIGYTKEPVAYETRLFVQKELDILGSRNALPEDFREVIRMLESGAFPVDETISAVVPMEEAGRMLAEWSAQPGKFTKIVVTID